MSTLKFGNGVAYECKFCQAITGETAIVAIDSVTWAQAAQIFSNPNATRRMEYGNFVLNGWTELVDLSKQPYGIQAVLKGGTVTERS